MPIASKHIIDSFVENLNIEELCRFRRSVLIPQQAANLLAAADEAEKILIEKEKLKNQPKKIEPNVPLKIA